MTHDSAVKELRAAAEAVRDTGMMVYAPSNAGDDATVSLADIIRGAAAAIVKAKQDLLDEFGRGTKLLQIIERAGCQTERLLKRIAELEHEPNWHSQPKGRLGMNGMQSKAARRRYAAAWSEDGLPKDASAWTIQDWKDLWEAMRTAAKKIAARHKEKRHAKGSCQDQDAHEVYRPTSRQGN